MCRICGGITSGVCSVCHGVCDKVCLVYCCIRNCVYNVTYRIQRCYIKTSSTLSSGYNHACDCYMRARATKLTRFQKIKYGIFLFLFLLLGFVGGLIQWDIYHGDYESAQHKVDTLWALLEYCYHRMLWLSDHTWKEAKHFSIYAYHHIKHAGSHALVLTEVAAQHVWSGIKIFTTYSCAGLLIMLKHFYIISCVCLEYFYIVLCFVVSVSFDWTVLALYAVKDASIVTVTLIHDIMRICIIYLAYGSKMAGIYTVQGIAYTSDLSWQGIKAGLYIFCSYFLYSLCTWLCHRLHILL